MDDKFAVPAPPGRSSTAAGPPVGVQVSGRDWQLLTIFELAKILVTEDDQETLLNQFLPSLIERLDAADAGSLWLVHAPDGRLCDTTVAVQGYGNVGSAAATILQEMGSTIVAMSDAGGRRYCPGGLDTTSLNEHVARHPRACWKAITRLGSSRSRTRSWCAPTWTSWPPPRWNTRSAPTTPATSAPG